MARSPVVMVPLGGDLAHGGDGRGPSHGASSLPALHVRRRRLEGMECHLLRETRVPPIPGVRALIASPIALEEKVEYVDLLDPEKPPAVPHVEVLLLVTVRLAVDALPPPLPVDVDRLRADDFEGAVHSQVAIVEEHRLLGVAPPPQAPRHLLQSAREEDGVRVQFGRPLGARSSGVVDDLPPEPDEDVGVQRRVPRPPELHHHAALHHVCLERLVPVPQGDALVAVDGMLHALKDPRPVDPLGPHHVHLVPEGEHEREAEQQRSVLLVRGRQRRLHREELRLVPPPARGQLEQGAVDRAADPQALLRVGRPTDLRAVDATPMDVFNGKRRPCARSDVAILEVQQVAVESLAILDAEAVLGVSGPPDLACACPGHVEVLVGVPPSAELHEGGPAAEGAAEVVGVRRAQVDASRGLGCPTDHAGGDARVVREVAPAVLATAHIAPAAVIVRALPIVPLLAAIVVPIEKGLAIVVLLEEVAAKGTRCLHRTSPLNKGEGDSDKKAHRQHKSPQRPGALPLT
mmetsp:Transcript_115919/g.361077  ORF Transcript_115919/g.361077 Transcript_115919/m.361077 type:complete len:519 (-) Transcript_115919:118-1674(-)